jgi:hypothetical protein
MAHVYAGGGGVRTVSTRRQTDLTGVRQLKVAPAESVGRGLTQAGIDKAAGRIFGPNWSRRTCGSGIDDPGTGESYGGHHEGDDEEASHTNLEDTRM